MTQYKFHLNNLRIAPRKVRLVANLIKKSSVLSAQAQLKFQIKKAALPILKLLKSGVASAVNNFNLSPENLYISNVLVDEGPKLKRFRARAFGRAGAIHKKTSHITLILEERIVLGASKKKKIVKLRRSEGAGAPTKALEEIKTETKPQMETLKKEKERIETTAPKEIKPRRSFGGITRRIFRRKAIG